MKLLFLFLISLNLLGMESIHTFKLKNHKGDELKLSNDKGKNLLVVNIATKCGYTPQLDDLEKLYTKYKNKNFEIIGIPSNDFGSQSPESNEGVAKFCRLKYGVNFPIIEKMKVLGPDKAEIFSYLQKINKGQEVSWNFEKFLFDVNGKFISHFESADKPLDGKLEAKLKALLK